MMRKKLFVTSCIIMIMGYFIQSEAQKVKTVDGVKVISNLKKPKPPESIPLKLRLVEDFAVGDSDKEEEMIAQITVFEVDSKGRLYILDMKASNVKVFDPSGKYMRTIGKKGQGPGELNLPGGLQITPENELMVEDLMNRRLAFFTLDGKFIKNVSVADKLSLINIVIDDEGRILGRELTLDEKQKMFWEVKKYTKDLKPLFSIDKVEFQNPMAGKMNIFDLLLSYQVGEDGNIFYGNPKKYEIKVFSPDGKHIKTITKKYDPIKITEEDIKRIMDEIPDMGFNIKDRFEFPKYFPAYELFTLDEQGRIFVRTYEKGKNEGEYFLDVFDPEGRYIAKIPLKADPRLWRENKMYSLEDSDEGFKVIKRYTVYWE